MSKKETTTDQNGIIDSTSKLEAIKNLIFGENIQQYDSEFEALKKDIDAKREALQNYVDETRDELMKSIDSLSTDVNIRITELESTLEDKEEDLQAKKVDKDTLGNLLISLGEKIQKK